MNNLILFIFTVLGGSAPLWLRGINDSRMQYLLAFSGSFLLSITFLHLIPETFEDIGSEAGLLLLAGFFIQLIIQRFTHGLEHGHVHIHQHEHKLPLTSVLVGLSIHAFMEGLPLGGDYHTHATGPALYMAVAVHKLPEAMLITLIAMKVKGRVKAIWLLLLFAAITPVAGILAHTLGQQYAGVSQMVSSLIPLVAGAFIHISTTIFFESGTKHHMLTWRKGFVIAAGVGIGLLTFMLE